MNENLEILKNCFWLIVFNLLFLSSVAQEQLKVDTSFTIQNTFVKESKKRAYISLAEKTDTHVLTIRQIPYKKTVDRILSLDAYLPQNFDSIYPCLILIHGGGWRSGNKEMMATMAKALADKYVVLSVEYRLSLEAKFPAAYDDLIDAILWAKSQKQLPIDMKRIGVVGTSSGGQLASLLGSNTHSNKKSFVKSVVNIDGILAFHHPESEEGEMASFWLGGTYQQNPAHWDDASPLFKVNSLTAPTLFLNSAIPRFHAGRSDMISKMNDFGIYSEVFEFEDSPHTFWFFNPWFGPMVDKMIAFLDRTL